MGVQAILKNELIFVANELIFVRIEGKISSFQRFKRCGYCYDLCGYL